MKNRQTETETDRQTDRDRNRERQIIKLNAFRDAVDSLLVCGTRIKSNHYDLIFLDILEVKLKLYFVMTLVFFKDYLLIL